MTALARLYPGDSALVVAAAVALAAAFLVATAATAERLFARHRPALRRTIWGATLVGVVLAPAAAAVRPHWPWRVEVLPAASVVPPTPAVQPAGPVASLAGSAHAVGLPPVTPPPLEPLEPPAADSFEPGVEPEQPPGVNVHHVLGIAAVVAWAAGVAMGVLRILVGTWKLRGLRRRSAPLGGEWAETVADVGRSLGATRTPDVRLSPDVRGPVAAGALSPIVYLPNTLPDCCDARQVRDVLLHECAHVLRRDPLVRLVQRLAAAVYWPHPAVHALNRRLDQACEDACDNAALAGTDPIDYAETLLTVARLCYPTPHTHEYLTMIPKRTSLEARVGRLLGGPRDPVTRTPTRQRAAVLAVLAVAMLAIPVVGRRAAEAAPPAPDGPLPAQPRPGESVEPSKPGEVTGRVVGDADGKPVAAADVRLRAADDTTVPYQTLRVASGADGRYVFRDVRPGTYRLWALAGDTASRDKMGRAEVVTVTSGGRAAAPDLRMRTGVGLRVRVTSAADGRPLAGARVRLTWTDTERDHLTGTGGDAQLRALTRETWTVEAGASRHGGATLAVDLSDGRDAAVELRLPPGSGIAGVVRGPDGTPVPGAGLSVFRATHEGGQLAYTKSDADGRYRLDYLPLGELQLSVSKRGYVREDKPFRLTAAAADPVSLDVAVTPRPHGGSARLTVTDAAGKPVPRAEAKNWGRSSDDVRTATAGAEGVLVLDDVFEGLTGHEAVVRAKGFASKVVRFKPGPKATPADVTVRLDPGHAVRGRVVDRAGKPVNDAVVRFGRGGFLGDAGGEERTDQDGRFAFDSLPADPTFSVSARGYSERNGQKLSLDGRETTVVTLEPEAAVRGRVLDAGTGKPVAAFTVSLTFSPDRRKTDPTAGILARLTDPGQTFAAADGRFAVGPLTAGMPFQVTVTAGGYRRGVVRRAEAGQGDGDEVEIRLKREDPAALFEVGGKVLDHTGRGVGGAEVRLIASEGNRPRADAFPFNWTMVESGQVAQVAEVVQFQRTTTGPGGEFRFRGVPPGVELELVHWGADVPPGRLRGLEKRAAGERTTLEIRTPAAATVIGTVDRTAYPDVGSVQLSGNDRFVPLKLAADGKSFSAGGLAAGKYEVQVYGPPHRVGDRGSFTTPLIARKSLTLTAGEAVRAEVGEADRQK
ncbi:carboxypeptidase regulatory-like domain-containing protein [Limnoglobus roseus]|uniref:Thioredoxin family protein n=1 Tax=Limnoglobus roseus TaxID=2598579 RepID=A0A5C1AL44_9BACT|nr:carboxypeptidase regulatory-like domain-containing protein [Limnoglobus roseus]QEL18873.1 thioredoxin family protein [Limnoglobus roseus]